jgi:hypothetical protein
MLPKPGDPNWAAAWTLEQIEECTDLKAVIFKNYLWCKRHEKPVDHWKCGLAYIERELVALKETQQSYPKKERIAAKKTFESEVAEALF